MLFRRLLFSVLLCVLAQAAWAQKTDIIILTNGDKITGEIKKLEAGLLTYSTDAMGTVTIEWQYILQIISDKQQTIETTDGSRWLGKIQKPEDNDQVQVVTVRGPVNLTAQDVVSVWPVQASFLDKLDLSLSLGYDFTKSTDIETFNLAFDLLYRTEKRIIEGSVRSDLTSQAEGDDQNRQEIRFNIQGLLNDRKYRSFNLGYDKNEAIGVERRLFGGGSYGKYFVKSNRTWFTGEIGANATTEQTTDGEQLENIEAVLASRYRYFSYARPERVLDTTVTIYPSLTDGGRVRGDLRSTFKLELVKDLFWNMEFYATYDNQPGSANAEKSDYGINTGIGWTY